MSATSALAAFGSKLSWNTVEIAELTNIGGPAPKAETVDATNFASPSAYREYIGTVLDGGEVSITANFIPGDTTGQIAMVTDFHAKTARTVLLV